MTMRRRDFVLGMAGGVGTLGVAGAAAAGGGCDQPVCDVFGYCQQTCEVGYPSIAMQWVAAQQRTNQWCWAASIEMAFGAFGFLVPQELFVSQTYGGLVNMPASNESILSSLNRTYIDLRGKRFQAIGEVIAPGPMALAQMMQDLAFNCPMILCYKTGQMTGHATVLTAINYTQDSYNQMRLNHVIVRDPWPLSPSKRPLTPQEWAGVSMVARVRCVQF
jgi:hypothetical protein